MAKPPAGSSLLFGALADSGRIKQRKNGSYRMVLKGVDEIDWFTDRPYRVGGKWSPKKLVRQWNVLFSDGAGAPNAQATFEIGKKRRLVTFEMFKPKFSNANQTLSCKVRSIGKTSKDLLANLRRKRLSNTSLFIDNGTMPVCLSNASSVDCSGQNFSNETFDQDSRPFNYFNLTGANFTNATLKHTQFVWANLTDANLSDTNLSYASLYGANLTGANLTGANLSYTKLGEANLTGAVFTGVSSEFGIDAPGANLTGTDFTGVNLEDSNFNSATITNTTKLDNANIAGVNFTDTDLTGIDFTGVSSQYGIGANFSGANLTGADFTGVNIGGSNFNSATITNTTKLDNAKIAGANFTDTDLTGIDFTGVSSQYGIDANFSGANLTGADFTGVDLGSSNFKGATITNTTKLDKANMAGANFTGSTLIGIDFTDANLTGSTFANAQLKNANLSGANLSGANLSRANLTNANLNSAKVKDTWLLGVTWADTTCPDGTKNVLGAPCTLKQLDEFYLCSSQPSIEKPIELGGGDLIEKPIELGGGDLLG